MKNIQEKIEKLKAELLEYSSKYYSENISVVSDIEFDTKLKELEKLEEEFPEFKQMDSPTHTVGGIASNKFKKVAHKYPMKSLSNTYSISEVVQFNQRVSKSIKKFNLAYILELKLDGLSIALHYEEGKLVQALTRGDGEIGEDVTDNIREIASIPQKLSQNFTGEIRGEIVLPISEFKRINENRAKMGEVEFANPRNAASGTLRQHDSKVVKERQLDGYFYFLQSPENYYISTHLESIAYIEKLGLKTTGYFAKCMTLQELENTINKYEKLSKKLNFETDGLVIKLNECGLYEQLGTTAKSPRWAIAYKFPAQKETTRLLAVTFQVGRTGVITPVAELEEVLLSGSRVKRASLHNFSEIKRKDIRIGDRVVVEKAAEIIPQVVSSIAESRSGDELKIVRPVHCPSCNSKLVEKGMALICMNRQCFEKVKQQITYFASRSALNIEGLGEKIVEVLLTHKIVATLSELYDLESKKSQLMELDGFGKKRVNSLLENIEKSKKISVSKFIYSLGISFVGSVTADILEDSFHTVEAIRSKSVEEFLAVNGIGVQTAQSIFDYFRDEQCQIELEELLSKGFQFTEKTYTEVGDSFFYGKKILITGSFEEFKRDDLKEIIKSLGAQNVASISKNTDILLVGNEPGSKLEKAQNYGIMIMTESEFKLKLTEMRK